MYCLGIQCGVKGPYGNGISEKDMAMAGTFVLEDGEGPCSLPVLLGHSVLTSTHHISEFVRIAPLELAQSSWATDLGSLTDDQYPVARLPARVGHLS